MESACWLISTQPSSISLLAPSFSAVSSYQEPVKVTSMVAVGQTERAPRKIGGITGDNLCVGVSSNVTHLSLIFGNLTVLDHLIQSSYLLRYQQDNVRHR